MTEMNLVRIYQNGHKLHDIFVRFQEHYESPEFKNKIFTKKEFFEWYAKDRGTSYYDDWAGFNLPSHIVDTFRGGAFDNLDEHEQILIKCCEGLVTPFYVIGVHGVGDMSTLQHEMAHALYYMNNEYRNRIEMVMLCLTEEENIDFDRWLKDTGYHEDVFLDEKHAYLMTNGKKMLSKDRRFISHQLCDIYNEYAPQINFLDFGPF